MAAREASPLLRRDETVADPNEPELAVVAVRRGCGEPTPSNPWPKPIEPLTGKLRRSTSTVVKEEPQEGKGSGVEEGFWQEEGWGVEEGSWQWGVDDASWWEEGWGEEAVWEEQDGAESEADDFMNDVELQNLLLKHATPTGAAASSSDGAPATATAASAASSPSDGAPAALTTVAASSLSDGAPSATAATAAAWWLSDGA